MVTCGGHPERICQALKSALIWCPPTDEWGGWRRGGRPEDGVEVRARGLWSPQNAAARKGACRKNEQAAPSLIPPSVPLFSSGQWALGYPTTSACVFGFPGL